MAALSSSSFPPFLLPIMATGLPIARLARLADEARSRGARGPWQSARVGSTSLVKRPWAHVRSAIIMFVESTFARALAQLVAVILAGARARLPLSES